MVLHFSKSIICIRFMLSVQLLTVAAPFGVGVLLLGEELVEASSGMRSSSAEVVLVVVELVVVLVVSMAGCGKWPLFRVTSYK